MQICFCFSLNRKSDYGYHYRQVMNMFPYSQQLAALNKDSGNTVQYYIKLMLLNHG